MTPRNNIVKLIMQAIPITIAMRTPETEKDCIQLCCHILLLIVNPGKILKCVSFRNALHFLNIKGELKFESLSHKRR